MRARVADPSALTRSNLRAETKENPPTRPGYQVPEGRRPFDFFSVFVPRHRRSIRPPSGG